MNMHSGSSGDRARARGGVATVLVGVTAVGVAVAAAISTLPPKAGEGAGSGKAGSGSMKSSLPKAKKRRAATRAEVRAALVRCDLTPKTLSASLVTAAATTTLVGNVRQYLTDHPDDLSEADSAFLSAQATFDRLEILVQQGKATEQDRSDYEAIQTTLASAKTARDAVVSSITTAAVASLTQTQQSTLATVKANHGWKVPVQYLVTTRTDSQWVALREALANQSQATAAGADPDPTCHQRVLDADALSETSAAVQNLRDHLAEVNTAYDTAVSAQ